MPLGRINHIIGNNEGTIKWRIGNAVALAIVAVVAIGCLRLLDPAASPTMPGSLDCKLIPVPPAAAGEAGSGLAGCELALAPSAAACESGCGAGRPASIQGRSASVIGPRDHPKLPGTSCSAPESFLASSLTATSSLPSSLRSSGSLGVSANRPGHVSRNDGPPRSPWTECCGVRPPRGQTSRTGAPSTFHHWHCSQLCTPPRQPSSDEGS